jgi:predicted ATPase/DNA-binding winged helix-turn-helix (wHTH) protein
VRAYSFGPFRLLPEQQLLLEGETPVRVGSRALEVLLALVERPGELVSKDELISRVWPNTLVEESNLKVNVAALRRALGEGSSGLRYIATAIGRGYRFVAPVETAGPVTPPVLEDTAAKRVHNIPAAATRLIGRADTIDLLRRQLPRHRLITVVGPGGVGKTTVAIAVAEAVVVEYDYGVWLVDLGPLRDERFIPSAVAAALGLVINSDNVIAALVAYLRDKQMLLILDNCEHVIAGAAVFVETIVSCARDVRVLATSREPLRVKCERLHRLAPLETPRHVSELTASAALTFPAVDLFVERAASIADYELSDVDAPVVADICRKLDGIALAIELAATRVDAFSIRELSALLNDRFHLPSHGGSTVPSRHQTLAATLDWSYQLLSEAERIILRRLSVFANVFSLDAASAVAATGSLAVSDVVEGVANLVAKSLASADLRGAVMQYRLLNTTRAYALQKLEESGEREAVLRRHAEYHRDLLGASRTKSRFTFPA